MERLSDTISTKLTPPPMFVFFFKCSKFYYILFDFSIKFLILRLCMKSYGKLCKLHTLTKDINASSWANILSEISLKFQDRSWVMGFYTQVRTLYFYLGKFRHDEENQSAQRKLLPFWPSEIWSQVVRGVMINTRAVTIWDNIL